MKYLTHRFSMIFVCALGVLLMALFSACAGVSTTANGSATITGSIKAVNVANGSVTVAIPGQSDITINGLSSAQATALQSQVGKIYTFTATPNSDGSYSINVGTNPVVASGASEGVQNQTPVAQGTPNANVPPSTNEPGSISFIGKVQRVNPTSIVVSMPDGSTLTMSIVNGQSDLSDFNGVLPTVGQTVKVDANANTDGSFMAAKLKLADQGDLNDQNTVEYDGITSSTVGSDRVIRFGVGNKSYTFTIGSWADLSDFNNNAQAIQANQMVKVKVLFNGSTGTVTKVSSSNGQ
jgi:hypothetical protein